MTTFGEFIDNLVVEIDNLNSSHEAYLRRALVRALRRVSPTRTMMMESTASFDLVADQTAYGESDAGFPVDVMDIITAYLSPATQSVVLIERRSLMEVREAQTLTSSTVSPIFWAWWQGKMHFAPIPAGGNTVKVDYLRDGTKDEITGELITAEGNDTYTNEWFDRGEDVLRCSVLMDYYNSLAKDDQAAAMMRRQYQEALASLTLEHRLQHASGQAPWHL